MFEYRLRSVGGSLRPDIKLPDIKSYYYVLAAIFYLATPSSARSNTPLTDADFRAADPAQAEVGRLLFYDKVLSGNRNISCSTCHHPAFGTSDGLSLGIGEGGTGIGPARTTGNGDDRIKKRVPRNAPALWNLGAKQIETLMHDGRINHSNLYGNSFNTPAQEWLPNGLDSVVAAQALFPMTSATEMAGSNEENEVAGAANDRIDNAWPIIAKRVRSIPAYADQFIESFDSIDHAEQINIVHVANALAAFINIEFRSTDSPYDQWLAGSQSALTAKQLKGKSIFYDKAHCDTCHAGSLFSNQSFKALALPAIGPGRTRPFDLIARDVGRMGESDRLQDAYRFRVPMLRNVVLTAPYGHNGTYPTLKAMIKHHLDPLQSRTHWTPDLASLPKASWLDATDFIIADDALEMQRQANHIDINLPALTDSEVDDIVAFLHSLTGEQAVTQDFYIPDEVPSGLPIDKPDIALQAE